MNEDTLMRLFRDGDQWCALIGENLQEGTAGFGLTPSEALHSLAATLADRESREVEGTQTA